MLPDPISPALGKAKGTIRREIASPHESQVLHLRLG